MWGRQTRRDTIADVVDVVLVLLLWIGSTCCSRLGFLIAMLDEGVVVVVVIDDFEAIEALDDKMDCYYQNGTVIWNHRLCVSCFFLEDNIYQF